MNLNGRSVMFSCSSRSARTSCHYRSTNDPAVRPSMILLRQHRAQLHHQTVNISSAPAGRPPLRGHTFQSSTPDLQRPAEEQGAPVSLASKQTEQEEGGRRNLSSVLAQEAKSPNLPRTNLLREISIRHAPCHRATSESNTSV